MPTLQRPARVVHFSPGRNLYSDKKKNTIQPGLIKMYAASRSLVKAFSCLRLCTSPPKRSKSMLGECVWYSLQMVEVGEPRLTIALCGLLFLAGWTGLHCEDDINECLPQPCIQGICIQNDPGYGYTCFCRPGFVVRLPTLFSPTLSVFFGVFLVCFLN